MYRIDSPDIAALKPAYNPAGTQGYFQDTTATPTAFTAQWCNHVQEELIAVILGMGLTLSGTDDTLLWTGLQARVSAVRSHASDTGSVSTDHDKAVIACSSSQAAGSPSAPSVCIAGDGLLATGDFSACVAGGNNEVSGDSSVILGGGYGLVSSTRAALVGGLEGILSGNMSALLGSYRAQLHTANAVGGGYGGGAITPLTENQNLSWLIQSNGGNAHFAGILNLGGDVDAGTGPLITLNGTNGNVGIGPLVFVVNGTTGTLTMAGDLDIGGGNFQVDSATGDTDIAGDLGVTGGATVDSLTLPWTGTGTADQITETYTESWVTVADGTNVTSTKANARIGVNSLVFWSWDFGTGAEHVTPGRCIITDEQVQFQLRNTSGGPLTGTWTIRYMVINPKA